MCGSGGMRRLGYSGVALIFPIQYFYLHSRELFPARRVPNIVARPLVPVGGSCPVRRRLVGDSHARYLRDTARPRRPSPHLYRSPAAPRATLALQSNRLLTRSHRLTDINHPHGPSVVGPVCNHHTLDRPADRRGHNTEHAQTETRSEHAERRTQTHPITIACPTSHSPAATPVAPSQLPPAR